MLSLLGLQKEGPLEVLLLGPRPAAQLPPAVRHLDIQGQLADQLNQASFEALGEILFFCFPGTRVSEGTLFAIKNAVINQEADGGGFEFVKEGSKERIKGVWWNFIFPKKYRAKKDLVFENSSGLFIRKQVLEKLGGFEASAGKEIELLSKKLLRRGTSLKISNPQLET